MGDQYDPGLGGERLSNRGKGSDDTRVVSDPAVFDRDIEILSDQDSLACKLKFLHLHHGHSSLRFSSPTAPFSPR
jgi:hypothetical protein